MIMKSLNHEKMKSFLLVVGGLMKKYTLKVYFGAKSAPAYFGGDKQDDSSEATPFQKALKRSRGCNSYAVCVCTGKELPLAVKIRMEKHHLARFPLTV